MQVNFYQIKVLFKISKNYFKIIIFLLNVSFIQQKQFYFLK